MRLYIKPIGTSKKILKTILAINANLSNTYLLPK